MPRNAQLHLQPKMFICFIKLLLIVCEDVGGTHVVVREQLPGADSHLPPFGDRVSPDAPAAAAACISPPPPSCSRSARIRVHTDTRVRHIQLTFFFFNVGPGDGT